MTETSLLLAGTAHTKQLDFVHVRLFASREGVCDVNVNAQSLRHFLIRDGKITCDLIWRKDVVTCLEGKGLPLAFISVVIAQETVTGSDF